MPSSHPNTKLLQAKLLCINPVSYTHLHLCLCVKLEVSFEDLYAGQPLFREIWRMMEDRGFALWDLESGLRGTDSKLLQADAVFVRRSTEAKQPRESSSGSLDRP